MNNITKAFGEWVKSFFTVLGVVFFLLSLQLALLPWSSGIIVPVTVTVGILTACVFSLAHVLIATDYITEKMSIKTRLIICIFPCGAIAGFFSRFIGLTHILGLTDGTHSLNVAILGWFGGLGLSIALMLLVFFFLELRFRKTGQLYDKALRAYKDSKA